MNNVIQKIISIAIIFILIFAVFVVTNLLTLTAKVSIDSKKIKFVQIPKNIKSEFLAKYKGLERIEILFNNPGLVSEDDYLVSIYDRQNNLIVSQKLNGFNIGDPGIFRIDLPQKIQDSYNKVFYIDIEAVNVSDNNLVLGVYSNDQIAVESYYKPDFDISYQLDVAVERMGQYFRNMWFLMLSGIIIIIIV